jgi:hypothetical protein
MVVTPRPIKLYPESDTDIFWCSPWVNISQSDTATELWIDVSCQAPDLFDQYIQHNHVQQIVFYDWYHTKRETDQSVVDFIVNIQQRYPTVFYTLNALNNPLIQNQKRFDFLWNRCKSAYLDGQVRWRQQSNSAEYVQYPLHVNNRSHKLLNLYGRPEPYREKLYNHLIRYAGFRSNWSQKIFLPTNADLNFFKSGAVLPAKKFMDDSYVTCQIESCYEGVNGIVYTEKTYDHLIQGRLVLNFGPQYYYHNLQRDGWKLPVGIDLSWDSLANTNERFSAYLDCLDTIFSDQFDLHGLFLTNLEGIVHNHSQLRQKPYDFIDQ